ncbi:hypothetical protein AVEN_59048-1, partial [Araneus ventricosus]
MSSYYRSSFERSFTTACLSTSSVRVQLHSKDLSFHRFRPRFALFPFVGTGRIEMDSGLVSAPVVSRIVAVNSSLIKGPDGAIASVHSRATEIFAKPRAIGTARLLEFHRPQSISANLERLEVWPSHTPLEQGFISQRRNKKNRCGSWALLAGNNGVTFTPWVILPGVYTSDVLRSLLPGTPPCLSEATNRTKGSYIETPRDKYSMKQRNPDFCSVSRSELLAIDMGLETIMRESNFGDLWILTDSCSSIQYLRNWTYIGDKISLSISQKLKLISLQRDVHFQWTPSHIDIHGNELADNLAKEGSSHPIPSSSEITFLELFWRGKAQNKVEWLEPPSHHCYKGRKPGLALSLPCDRQSSTCLSRLASGHLKCLTYSEGNKIYPLCPKSQRHQTSPKHILDCLGLDWEEIYSSPFLLSRIRSIQRESIVIVKKFELEILTNLHVLDLPESEKHNFGIMSVCVCVCMCVCVCVCVCVCEHDNSKTIR